MISRRTLTYALRDRRLADWVVIEREQDIATVRGRRSRFEDRTLYTVVVHLDTPRGRGTARVDITGVDGSARDVVDRAIALATAALGPPWRATPPAAPARVALMDPELAQAPLDQVVTQTLSSLPSSADIKATTMLEILRERVTAETQAGLRTGWSASGLRARIRLASETSSLDIVREARQLADLRLTEAIASATTDLARIGTTAPRSGTYALVLRPEAMLHGGGLGVWNVFASHATAELERQGLVRYRLKAPIAPGANQIDEPITITSDGSLDYATRSAPLSDDGAAVRRFALVEQGIAAGLGMSMREAARRKLEPNGGVRNLVVSSGTWTATSSPHLVPVLDVLRLRSVAVDPHTGDATLEIALAIDRSGGGEQFLTGGQVRLDLVGALARAKRSATPLRRGAYFGPDAVFIDNVDLLA